jgi:hypothetical protein
MLRKVMLVLFPLIILLIMMNCSKEPVVPASTSPVINAIEAQPNIVSKGGKVYVNLAVTDREEDKMYFEWSCPNGQFYSDSLLQNVSNESNPCWWKAPEEEKNFTLSVTCTDSISNPVDTSITVSVSIYSLDSIIGENEFGSPFAMYLDDEGKMYVTDPGLSSIHYYNNTKWISWNYFGLDTSVSTDTVYYNIDTIVTPHDTSYKIIKKTLIGKDLYDSPSAICVDEDINYVYVANVEIESTIVSVYDFDKMFTPEDTVTALSYSITYIRDDSINLYDTLTDTLSLDTLCLYGYQFGRNDRTDLSFRIKSPFSFAVDPITRLFYISTEISIICYDSTWTVEGWERQWSYATATGGINYQGKGMDLYNDALYLASFKKEEDSTYSVVRRFIDIGNPTGPTADDANFWIQDEYTAYVSGLAVSPVNDHIFVAEGGGSESSLHRVVEYDGNGDFVRTFGCLGESPDQFNFPTDIFLDPDGKIYVVDMGNHCIKVFKE